MAPSWICRIMSFSSHCTHVLFVCGLCSVVKSPPTLCDPRDCSIQASLSFTIPWSLLKFMSIESVMLSNHFILCHLPSPFALNLSQHQGLFQRVGVLHQVAKVLEFQLQQQSFEYSRLISFRIDWFDLAVEETFKSLLQHHNSKALILWCSSFNSPTLISVHDY